jgi:acyl-CoA dehydrogenase
MDLINAEQRAWQMKARKFAQEEIRPISLQRDRVADPRGTWDWEIIRKGSRLGFRTAVVPKEWGGHAIDFVTQALVMAELAKADSAISKAFSQNWKWGHLIAGACSQEQKERFLKPFMADDTYVLGYGGTEPNAGSDNRYPPADDPRSGLKLKAERQGDAWILNGEKCFIANGGVGKLFFVGARTNPNVPVGDGTTVFMVPIDTPGFRIGKVYNKSGWRFYQSDAYRNGIGSRDTVLGERGPADELFDRRHPAGHRAQYGYPRRSGRRHGCIRRQAGARRHHLVAPGGGLHAAPEGRAAPARISVENPNK